MNKTVQYFDDAYLVDCRRMNTSQILRFLEDYRQLHNKPGNLVQINLRVPKNTLAAFKARAEREGVLYQRKLRELMTQWALGD